VRSQGGGSRGVEGEGGRAACSQGFRVGGARGGEGAQSKLAGAMLLAEELGEVRWRAPKAAAVGEPGVREAGGVLLGRGVGEAGMGKARRRAP
jgi:hypothetical protein